MTEQLDMLEIICERSDQSTIKSWLDKGGVSQLCFWFCGKPCKLVDLSPWSCETSTHPQA